MNVLNVIFFNCGLKIHSVLLFFMISLPFVAKGQIDQFPQIYRNGQGSGGADLVIRTGNSSSSPAITELSSTALIGADRLSTNSGDTYFMNWVRISLPSISGTSNSPNYGYLPCNEFYGRINAVNVYATVNTSSSPLGVRTCAGCTSSYVKSSGQNIYYGKGSILALTGNTSSGWYEIYLPNGTGGYPMSFSQPIGWVDGQYLTFPSSQNYKIVGGRICTNADDCNYLGSVNQAVIQFSGLGSTYSSGGNYEYKVPSNWSGTITCMHPDYNSSSPVSYSISDTSNNYTRHFVMSNMTQCQAPTRQASNITFYDPQTDRVTLNWTNGDGSRRVVMINRSNNFTPPANGTFPTPNSNYLGSGQQVMYNSSGSGIVVTGLSANTTYWFRVFEFNCTENETRYLTSQSGTNPVSFNTPANMEIPVPSMSVNRNNIDIGDRINFSGTATNNPTEWQWTFDGGIPSSSTQQNPSNIRYTSSGIYRVTLRTCNAAGCNTQAIPGYVTVKGNTTQTPDNNTIQGPYCQCLFADPIQIGTRTFMYEQKDVDLNILADNLTFNRFYNSLNNTRNSPLGYGWSHTFNYQIQITDEGAWEVHHPDGHIATFIPLYNSNGTSFPLYGGTHATLTKDGSGDYKMTTKDKTEYDFNSSGRLVSIKNPNGNTTNLTYSGNNLSSVQAPGGRTITITNSSNRITLITDPLGRQTNYAYDVNGNLTTVTDAKNGQTNFTYDGNHRLLSVTNPLGVKFLTNTYDAQGRAVSQTDANNQTATIAYDVPSAGFSTITFPDGTQNEVEHDAHYRLVYSRDESGYARKRYLYNEHHKPVSITNEANQIEIRKYDDNGNLLQQTLPGNRTTSYTYNSFSKPLQVTDPLGKVTTFGYNAKGELTSVHLPDNTQRSFFYNANGTLGASTDGRGNTVSYSYNASGDLTQITAPNGNRALSYDAAGRPVTMTDERGNVSAITYDNNDNITLIRDALGQELKFAYNADNKLTAFTDKKGKTTPLSMMPRAGRFRRKTR